MDNNQAKVSILKIKGIISTLMILLAILTFFTGAVLYFHKYGMWWIFTRKFINDVHALSALLMAIGIFVHFYLNRKLYKMEMKELLKK